MKNVLLFLFFIIISCKQKNSFADDITLEFPKDEKLTFQEFNEGVDEMGSSIIYIGLPKKTIEVKYYKSPFIEIISPLSKDSMDLKRDELLESYFHENFHRKLEKSDNKNVLNEKNLVLTVDIKDTIPRYNYNIMSPEIKKYKAFPVFVKNIAGKNLEITEFSEIKLKYKISEKEWKNIYNHNYYICGSGLTNLSWTLQPNEIIIASQNFYDGKDDGTFKICLGNVCSEPFKMKFDKKIIELQR